MFTHQSRIDVMVFLHRNCFIRSSSFDQYFGRMKPKLMNAANDRVCVCSRCFTISSHFCCCHIFNELFVDLIFGRGVFFSVWCPIYPICVWFFPILSSRFFWSSRGRLLLSMHVHVLLFSFVSLYLCIGHWILSIYWQ